MTKFKLGHNKFFLLLRISFCCPVSIKRKNVIHEQGLSVQLSIVGHFFQDAPPKRNCLGTSLVLLTVLTTLYVIRSNLTMQTIDSDLSAGLRQRKREMHSKAEFSNLSYGGRLSD